jgi:hypothetical protein
MTSYFQIPSESPSLDVRTLRLLIGCIAIGLAVLVQAVSPLPLTSISGSYFSGDWPRNFFVGCLFFIACFMIAYNGKLQIEAWLSKAAALAAIGVAVFPCDCAVEATKRGAKTLQCLGISIDHYSSLSHCTTQVQEIRGAHGAFAFVMFGILAVFCYIFYKRAKAKEDERRTAARRRMWVYSTALILIVAAITALLVDRLFDGIISHAWPTFVFWGEFVGLVSFGASWLTASYIVPGMAHEQREQFHPLRRAKPAEPSAQQ